MKKRTTAPRHYYVMAIIRIARSSKVRSQRQAENVVKTVLKEDDWKHVDVVHMMPGWTR
jgi:hypothetical protein